MIDNLNNHKNLQNKINVKNLEIIVALKYKYKTILNNLNQ